LLQNEWVGELGLVGLMFLDERYGDCRAGLIPREPFPIDYRRYPLAVHQHERRTGTRHIHYSHDKQWGKAAFSMSLRSSKWQTLDPPLPRRHFCEPSEQTSQVLTNENNCHDISLNKKASLQQPLKAYASLCRSQWPHVLTHQMSSLTRTLGSWVRIPFKAWMSACAFFLCLCCRVCR
jgi:hypothetical protein